MYKICSCTHTISIETNNIHVCVCARVCVCVRACVFPLLSFGSACVHQRRLCSPAAVLPYHVTSHLLRVRSQIARLHCPTHISLLPSFSTDVIPPPPRVWGGGKGGNTRVWGSFYRGIKGKHYSKNLKRVWKRKMKRGEMES